DREARSNRLCISIPQVSHGLDTHLMQPLRDAAADTPDLVNGDGREQARQLNLCHYIEVAHPVPPSESLLRAVVGQLGQGFRCADTDTHRQPKPLGDSATNLNTVAMQASQVQPVVAGE